MESGNGQSMMPFGLCVHKKLQLQNRDLSGHIVPVRLCHITFVGWEHIPAKFLDFPKYFFTGMIPFVVLGI